MRITHALLALAAVAGLEVGFAGAQETNSWRYYRPGNTGIQGDYNETIWIGADGDPWIGGYDPIAEEGGIARFVQAENRWINVSNIDYQVIGSANDLGYCRATDMVADGLGNLWIGTWRGALRMNLAAGPSSLVRFGPENSALPGGVTSDLTRAPDGTIWISGDGGLYALQPSHQPVVAHQRARRTEDRGPTKAGGRILPVGFRRRVLADGAMGLNDPDLDQLPRHREQSVPPGFQRLGR